MAGDRELDIAWLAGFFDGEGCISVYRVSKRDGFSLLLTVTAVNTGKEAIERACRIAGAGSVSCRRRSGHQPLWTWRVYEGRAQEVLRMLLPHLTVKRCEAEIAVQFPRPGHVRDAAGRMTRCSPFIRLGQLAAWRALRKVSHGRYANAKVDR